MSPDNPKPQGGAQPPEDTEILGLGQDAGSSRGDGLGPAGQTQRIFQPQRMVRETQPGPTPSKAEGKEGGRPRLCCWVAILSSITALVLALLLWLRPAGPAAPAIAPAVGGGAAPASAGAEAAPTPGSPEAFQAALQPYLQAAQGGDTSAMRMLGAMYYHGLNLPRNREEGLKWYRKAAESGSKVAKEELRQME